MSAERFLLTVMEPAQNRHDGWVRRGLVKDLANTPTQIACGWKLYEDIARLSALGGSEVAIELTPPLALTDDVVQWMSERLVRDRVPQDTITSATLALRPRIDDQQRLMVECSTTLATSLETYESRDTARWHASDV